MFTRPSRKPLRILVVEDTDSHFELVQAALSELAHTFILGVLRATTCAEAKQILDKERTDVVLLDLFLPDSKSVATLTALRPHAAASAIVVMTALEDKKAALEAMENGADDYLVKGKFDGDLLMRSLRYAIERKRGEELNRFVPALVHDLKVHIAGGDRALEMLQLSGAGNAAGSGHLLVTLARQANHETMSLINNLLVLYRSGAESNQLTIEDLELMPFVEQVLSDLKLLIEQKKHRVELSLPDRMRLSADRLALGRLLRNLLHNSIKFTPRGGLITIQAEESPDASIIRISDNGPGIPAADQAYIFQPFWQGKSTSASARYMDGSGLGLNICKQLAEAHGGRLVLENRPEKTGCTFRLELPRGHGEHQ